MPCSATTIKWNGNAKKWNGNTTKWNGNTLYYHYKVEWQCPLPLQSGMTMLKSGMALLYYHYKVEGQSPLPLQSGMAVPSTTTKCNGHVLLPLQSGMARCRITLNTVRSETEKKNNCIAQGNGNERRKREEGLPLQSGIAK